MDEVHEVIKCMKNLKAPGPNRISCQTAEVRRTSTMEPNTPPHFVGMDAIYDTREMVPVYHTTNT